MPSLSGGAAWAARSADEAVWPDQRKGKAAVLVPDKDEQRVIELAQGEGPIASCYPRGAARPKGTYSATLGLL